MRTLAPILLLGGMLAPGVALAATTYYVATTGSDDNGGITTAAPFRTIGKAAAIAQPGDMVYIRGGTYTDGVSVPGAGGTSSAWITFSAYPGELPILDGNGAAGSGFSSTTAQYIRVVGLAVRNWSASGFGNGWVNDAGKSNGNWQFVNCIADGNGVSGIDFHDASGLLVDACIVAHNGNKPPSGSGGVGLYHVTGTNQDNVVRRTVSFENIDISAHHADGSGFVIDQNSSGATFENNIGFRNGGSCIRVTSSPNGRFINNTCWHDGQDPVARSPAGASEISFADAASRHGVIMFNNLGAASGPGGAGSVFNTALGTNNVAMGASGATPFSGRSPPGKGIAAGVPPTDIGFDPRCLRQQPGQAVAWWQYTLDYAYISSAGGVSGCFHPRMRPADAAPDVGAYQSTNRAPTPRAAGRADPG